MSAVRRFEVNVNQRHFQVAITEIIEKTSGAAKLRERPTAVSRIERVNGDNNTGEVRSAMNGLVKQILVKEGDRVEAGQKLIIFEAMKMESEIVSAKAGQVKSIKVKQGQTVDASALLVLLGD